MIHEDMICPFCGCLCDDLVIETEGAEVVRVDNACTLGSHKLMNAGKHRLKAPIMREGGRWRDAGYEEAIEYTAGILLDADRPLLYGWSSTQGEAQGAGVSMAELLGGVIDSTTSVCHGPSILAIQEVGHPGCTLGQVKNRADLIVYWGCNPTEAHPRHMSRYTTYADGYFLENAFRDRKLVIVDVRKTETGSIADEFVQVKPGGDYAVLSALRAIVRGRDDVVPPMVAGVTKEQLLRVAALCKEAKFGALFFGVGLTMSPGKYKNVRNAIELVDDLNRYTKWTLTPLRGHYNVYGSNEVFTWMTGYPYAVDFSRQIAFYNPGETTAVDILARKECDAALIVASDPGAHFPKKCLEHLASIPTVLIDPMHTMTTPLVRCQIPTAVTGMDASGTAYRMDGVPIHVKKFLDLGYPSDTEIIGKIFEKVTEVRHP